MSEGKEKNQLIDFLGGFCGGVVSTYVGHPLDTVKVRMQVSQMGSQLIIGSVTRSYRGIKVLTVHAHVQCPQNSIISLLLQCRF